MPFGTWRDFDSCMADPALLSRYPGDEQRRRVCGALQARLEAKKDQAAASEGDAIAFGGKITEGDGFWIVHDAVAARDGVNVRGELKPWEELQKAAPTLEGAPLLYGRHPIGQDGSPIVHYDPHLAVGYAINVHLEEGDHTLRYDALLFKEAPAGYGTPAEDIARNHATIALVKEGGSVENSVGYYVGKGTAAEAGFFKQDGGVVAYREVQRSMTFGHIALLKPIGGSVGGACGPACAVGVDDAGHEGSCKGGDGCCKKRAAKAADELTERFGISRGAAMQLIAKAEKKPQA
jgi:hypothetical protein